MFVSCPEVFPWQQKDSISPIMTHRSCHLFGGYTISIKEWVYYNLPVPISCLFPLQCMKIVKEAEYLILRCLWDTIWVFLFMEIIPYSHVSSLWEKKKKKVIFPFSLYPVFSTHGHTLFAFDRFTLCWMQRLIITLFIPLYWKHTSSWRKFMERPGV